MFPPGYRSENGRQRRRSVPLETPYPLEFLSSHSPLVLSRSQASEFPLPLSALPYTLLPPSLPPSLTLSPTRR